MNVCDHTNLQCAFEAQANYSTQELEIKLVKKQLKRDLKHGKANKKDSRFGKIEEMEKSSCNCLPSCTNIKYEVGIDRIQFEKEENEDG